MEEEKTKGRTWNGYVCPGCRTVFRVAADFGGAEVMCPSCNGTLRLPKTPEEVPPQTARPEILPVGDSVGIAKPTKPTKPARTADLQYKDTEPSALQKLLASSDGRLKLTLALLLPLALLVGALVVLPPEDPIPDKSLGEVAPSRPESDVPAEPAPPPPPIAVNEMPVPDEEPVLPEVAAPNPVPETMPESLPKPVEPKPVEPEPEVVPEPVAEVTPPPTPEPPPPVVAKEEDLVPALPAIVQAAPEKPEPEPAAQPQPEPEPGAAPVAPPAELIHTVVRGDTLTKLAGKYQVSIATIKKANSMRSDVIMLDQKLKIPGGIAPAAEPATPKAATPKAAATPAPPKAPAPASHTVVRGDTLERIARKYGVTPQQVMQANGMKNDVVRLGRKLVIPPATP